MAGKRVEACGSSEQRKYNARKRLARLFFSWISLYFRSCSVLPGSWTRRGLQIMAGRPWALISMPSICSKICRCPIVCESLGCGNARASPCGSLELNTTRPPRRNNSAHRSAASALSNQQVCYLWIHQIPFMSSIFWSSPPNSIDQRSEVALAQHETSATVSSVGYDSLRGHV